MGFKKNLVYAFFAQGFSLAASILAAFAFPLFLSVEEYGYWQLFIFYAGYCGLFSLGVIDGIYLLNGGKKLDELDNSSLLSQWLIGLVLQCFWAIVIIFLASLANLNTERRIVLYLVAIYLIIQYSTFYWGYLFQAINRTKWYSISIILNKSIFLLLSVLLLLTKRQHLYLFCLFYIIGVGIAAVYEGSKIRHIWKSRLSSIQKSFKDFFISTNCGIKLLLANFSGMLIIGTSRLVVDCFMGISYFSKLSFGLQLTNFFLLFMSQVSLVLFPMICRTDIKNQTKIYNKIRALLFLFSPIIFIQYYPLVYILRICLPQYTESFYYLIFLLPVCLYDGKMNLLYNTYLKARRKEKFMLVINLCAVGLSLTFSLIGVLAKSILFVVVSIPTITFIRSYVSERYLAKEIEQINNSTRLSIAEILICIIFVLLNIYLDFRISLLAYAMIYILYLFLCGMNCHKTVFQK